MDMKVREDLKRGLEAANQLRILYSESRCEQKLENETLIACMNHYTSVILNTFETAISTLNEARSTNPNTILKYRKYYNRRTTQPQHVKTINSNAIPEDSYSWRKYGQKPIANTKHPREYYRCGHKDEGCPATMQVQLISENPTMYQINYYGHHTCQNLHKNVSQFDQFLDSIDKNIICFGSSEIPTKAKQGLNLIEQEQEQEQGIIKEGKPLLPHDQDQHHSSSLSIDLTALNPVVDDVGLPRWCYSLTSPLFVDQNYLMTQCVELDGGFDELRLWEI